MNWVAEKQLRLSHIPSTPKPVGPPPAITSACSASLPDIPTTCKVLGLRPVCGHGTSGIRHRPAHAVRDPPGSAGPGRRRGHLPGGQDDRRPHVLQVAGAAPVRSCWAVLLVLCAEQRSGLAALGASAWRPCSPFCFSFLVESHLTVLRRLLLAPRAAPAAPAWDCPGIESRGVIASAGGPPGLAVLFWTALTTLNPPHGP